MTNKRTNIPHQPGAIAASTWSQPSSQKPQDLVDGYVVGKDNTTGQAIVTDGASQLKGITQGEISIYQFAAFTRPESGEGGRLGRIQATGENFSAIDTPALTQNFTDAKSVEGCGSGFGSGGREDPNPEPTEEELPSEPPEEPEAEDPPATLGDIANSSPYNPQPNPAEEDTSTGCTTTSDCQWYDAISLDQPCPYGTTKKGATEITPGVFMILCCGEERPVGDGCPVDSSQLGWTCTNGTCTQTQGGQFATEEECLASGCLKQTWTCTPNGCVELFDGSGEFDSLEACQLQCSGLGWDCVNGTCQQVSGGRFATQALCEASGCGAGSASPDSDYCDGDAGAVLTWSSGSVESFNPPISYSVSGGAGGISVDWGGGVVDLLDGVSWTVAPVNTEEECVTWAVTVNITEIASGNTHENLTYTFRASKIAPRFYYCYSPTFTRLIAGIYATRDQAFSQSCVGVTFSGSLCGTNDIYRSITSPAYPADIQIVSVTNSSPTSFPGSSGYRVESNTGDFIERIAASPPSVSLLEAGFTLTVTDNTGEIFSQTYETEPTGFTYSCRN